MTNYIEYLDKALIRPSRIDKKTVDYKESKHEFGDKAIKRLTNDFTSKKNLPFGATTSDKN
ncbi:hypothetical protein N7475_007955 [Penicillium sp. IBT 31633x]|nr:hypothetical protein N7475_007955 [Penicillium sp. IBT 31633x]